VRDGWLNNPVFYAVLKLIRLRSNCETLNIDKGGERAKTLKGGSELNGDVTEIKKNL
jgi:hypothetical protein